MEEPELMLIGSYLSPYVRKVLVCLHLKGLRYAIDPIVPFFGNEAFARLNPVRRIPVLIDADLVVSDSTVICEYLDEAYPQAPRLLPSSPRERAQARWLEELVDTRVGDVIIWRLFNQLAINPHVWSVPTDEAVVRQVREVELPELMSWLEEQAPAGGFLFGEVSVADVAVGAMFRNAAFVGHRVDAARWPRLHDWLDRLDALAAFRVLSDYEQLCLRTPIARQRQALAEAGAPLTATTLGTDRPVRGAMSI